jgi:hypothetical protein
MDEFHRHSTGGLIFSCSDLTDAQALSIQGKSFLYLLVQCFSTSVPRHASVPWLCLSVPPHLKEPQKIS